MATNQTQAQVEGMGIFPEKWNEHGVVPEVLDQVPPHPMQLEYSGNIFINNGTELLPSQTKLAPTRISWPVEAGSFYTLCMLDADAPIRGRAFLSPINHWLVINIPDNDISAGRVLTRYLESRPPPGGGLHRYIFLVFKQTTAEIKPEAVPKFKFNLKEFATKYDLGQPVAGNFYVAQGSLKESCCII